MAKKIDEKELRKLQQESSMNDPNAWKFKSICQECINKLGGGCDVFADDREEMIEAVHEAQSTGKCEFFIKKH